jgi:hypothetical protein
MEDCLIAGREVAATIDAKIESKTPGATP